MPPFCLPIEGQSLRKVWVQFFVDPAGELTDMAGTRLDGTTVYDDSGTIVTNGSHETAWHVFVTAWDGDVSVVVLRHDHSFDGVCDDISAG